MKSVSLFLLISVCLITLSCSEKETPAGVKYTVLKAGDGVEVQAGTYILAHMILKDAKDSILADTYAEDRPLLTPMPDASMANDPGVFGVVKLLTKGDCVTFKIPAQTVYTSRRRAVPKNVDPAGLFTYTIQLKETWTFEEARKYEEEQVQKMTRKTFVADSTAISNYVKENGLQAITTKSGLTYVVKKEGKGDLATTGKTALVHYAGFTLDGKIFDTSMARVAKEKNFDNGGRNEPYPVVVNQSSVIAGWHEMLQLMNKGMQVTVLIPSSLGYGPQGNGPAIPPNAVLMFDMEIADLK